MSNHRPVPPPGLAVFPSLLSSQPLSLTMKGSAMDGSDYTFIDNASSSAGATVFSLDSKSFSVHRKKTLFDASNQPLLAITKQTWTLGYKYSASDSSGRDLFRTETHGTQGLVNGGDTLLTFTNQTNGQPTQLQFRNQSSMNVHAEVIDMGSGLVVAKIDKQNWKMRHQYQIEVAPGMDPSIVCALAVIMADIRVSKSSAASAAGAGGGGGGGGGGG